MLPGEAFVRGAAYSVEIPRVCRYCRRRCRWPLSLSAYPLLISAFEAQDKENIIAPTLRKLAGAAEGGDLETLAELIAVTDFAAVYLALASTA